MSTLAQEITRDLGGIWKGSYGLAPCPGHSKHDRSMTIRDKDGGTDVLINTFGGTDWRDARAQLVAMGYLGGDKPRADASLSRTTTTADIEEEAQRRSRQAVAIWREAASFAGTPADAYLGGRAIFARSDRLRFHPAAPVNPYSSRSETCPAMVALVEGESGPIGCHITYLDGEAKRMRKMAGRMKGGAVRLMAVRDVLAVGEGIETSFSLSELYRVPAWATLSAEGMAAVELPAGLKRLMIGFDRDPSKVKDGREIGLAGLKAAKRLAERARAAGVAVMLCPPPIWAPKDWNGLAQAAMA